MQHTSECINWSIDRSHAFKRDWIQGEGYLRGGYSKGKLAVWWNRKAESEIIGHESRVGEPEVQECSAAWKI